MFLLKNSADILLKPTFVPTRFQMWGVPALALALVILCDYSLNDVILTPLLALTTLAILAFVLRPTTLACWAFIYAVGVYAMLYRAYGQPGADSSNAVTLYVRTGSFIVGSSIAVALCNVRNRALQQYQAMRGLFSRLPIAIIVSDGSGIVLFSNDRAQGLLAMTEEEILGQSIFSLGKTGSKKGQTIQAYISLSETRGADQAGILELGRGVNRTCRFTQSSIQLMGHDCVITTLTLDECFSCATGPQSP